MRALTPLSCCWSVNPLLTEALQEQQHFVEIIHCHVCYYLPILSKLWATPKATKDSLSGNISEKSIC